MLERSVKVYGGEGEIIAEDGKVEGDRVPMLVVSLQWKTVVNNV